MRNPFNVRRVSRIPISPEVVDCIVFWTKNPEPMLGRLCELKEYHYYFQFTLTGYGQDIEPGLPDKKEHMTRIFKALSDRAGADRVIWRYDPILINDRYTEEYQIKVFADLAGYLKGYTGKVMISFLDLYAGIRRNMEKLKVRNLTAEDMMRIAARLAQIASENGMLIESCAEQIDLRGTGVLHGSCIDKGYIETLTDCKLSASKDKNQRKACGCIESIDVGTYGSCLNGCKYCYAGGRGIKAAGSYDPDSPVLCGRIEEGDTVTERSVRSLMNNQISIFDL